MTTRIARLFKNGASQAVRLPAEFRFSGEEVYATRDERTGDVILSAYPGSKVWADYFEFIHSFDVSDDFMENRPLNSPPKERSVFESERER